MIYKGLDQGSPNLFLEGRCPAEFSYNSNQTHLNQLIKVLLGILETSRQVCWGKLELNSAGHRPSRNECGDPWSRWTHSIYRVCRISVYEGLYLLMCMSKSSLCALIYWLDGRQWTEDNSGLWWELNLWNECKPCSESTAGLFTRLPQLWGEFP